MGIIWVAPRVGLRRRNIVGCKGIASFHSDVHAGSNYGPSEAHPTSLGCGNLVPEPSHTTSGDTLVRALWTVAERAGSTGNLLAKLTTEPGSGPT